MQTVKYIDQQNTEWTYPADMVAKRNDNTIEVWRGKELIANYAPSSNCGSDGIVQSQKVYVMNEAGKTVASYTL